MKKLIISGLFLALYATKMSAGTSSEIPPRFNDVPKVTPIENTELRAALVTATVIIYGTGGVTVFPPAVCPDPGTTKCAEVITAFVAGGWGPDADITDEAGYAFGGTIESPIEVEGEVVNFNFSEIHEL
jgi:hypothetical protein